MNYFAAQMGFAFHFVLPGIGTQGVVHAKHVALNRGTSTTLDQNFNIILKLGTQTIFTKKIFQKFLLQKGLRKLCVWPRFCAKNRLPNGLERFLKE